LKDLQIADKKRHLKKAEEKVFERLLGYLMIFFRAAKLQDPREYAV
jgi:hypothetical protein